MTSLLKNGEIDEEVRGEATLDGPGLGGKVEFTKPSQSTLELAPGVIFPTAHTILQWSDATVTTAPGCDPVFTTFELRVYPPGQYSATYAAFDLEACSHAGPIYLSVGPIRPGVGTING